MEDEGRSDEAEVGTAARRRREENAVVGRESQVAGRPRIAVCPSPLCPLLPLTSYLLPLTSYLLPLTSYLLPLTSSSYLLPPTAHRYAFTSTCSSYRLSFRYSVRGIDPQHLGRSGLVAALRLEHPHDVGALDHLEGGVPVRPLGHQRLLPPLGDPLGQRRSRRSGCPGSARWRAPARSPARARCRATRRPSPRRAPRRPAPSARPPPRWPSCCRNDSIRRSRSSRRSRSGGRLSAITLSR